jgi:hypothetical protein
MSKLGIFASLTAFVLAIGVATLSPTAAVAGDGPTPCQHKDFKTDMVKEACAKGGQPAAKEAMKQFQKDHKLQSCNQCHKKLAPNYELKDDALDQFTKLGGK